MSAPPVVVGQVVGQPAGGYGGYGGHSGAPNQQYGAPAYGSPAQNQQAQQYWMLYAAGCGCLWCCGCGPIALILWCSVGFMFYSKPKAYQDANPDEKLVARVSLCSACGGVCCMVIVVILLAMAMAFGVTEGDACPEGAYECQTRQMSIDEMETCECWNGTYTGRRRGGSFAEKQEEAQQQDGSRRRR